MTTEEEIKAEYASSLADLTFNSKPLINVLTMLADENSPNAKVIVEAIETHLSKVATDIKLTILYLIDCIVKNVGGTYTTLFSQNIVSTFCGVFKAVDERTRAEMFKLRQTWNDVFPQKKLYAIDVQINLLDPAWPVTAKPPSNSIHFNPKFLKTTTTTSKPKINSSDSTPIITSTTVPGNVDKETLLMQEKLIQKQKELLELQQKKLELEVLQTQVKLQEQIKNKGPAISLPTRPQNILLKPEVAEQLVPSAIKSKPMGINSTLMQQKIQSNGPRINPVSTALVSAVRPIRDPRLLRQQQKADNSNSNNPLDQQKTTVLANNKIVTNKMGIRKIRNDPRLINKDDNFPQKIDTTKTNNLSKSRNSDLVQKSHKTPRSTSKSSSDSVSSKSSSSSSLDSPIKSKGEKKSPVKHKKRDKSDEKKIFSKDDKRDKVQKSDSPTTTFKGVKTSTKNRNYVRRNLAAISPEPPHDEDLRSLGPPEKQPRLQGDSSDDQIGNVVSTTKGMDTDLRLLPAVIGKKRSSIDSDDQSPVKRSKIEVFDKLFGDEDTDLRQLSINNDRPPTPPPPIISSSDCTKEKSESPKSNLDAVRAKLANATNRDKIMAKSFNKKRMAVLKDQDLRVAKVSSTTDMPNKIIISPEDESSIKSGTLTKEQETNLLNKIIMQIEKNKLKEAQKKDHEESFNISLQPISDDELVDSDEEKNATKEAVEETTEVNDSNVIPFNDKDERVRPQLQQQSDFVHSSFPPRDIRRPLPPPSWRGGNRGGRRYWDNHPGNYPRMPGRPWNHPNSWRNAQSNFPGPREFPVHDKEEEISEGPDASEDQLTNGAVNQDEIKTINIDGVPKDIRFYDETAIAFISWDNPREISFQDGTRRVTFNNTESYLLGFNKPYQEVLINGSPHLVRLGAPSREIYIDHVPYECYFGSVGIRIVLNGASTTVKLEGPPPQVKIGENMRTDLVAGKINLFINAQIVVPVFLDAKVQKFIIEGETSTLKFVNALETVLINDVPLSVEYGGLPKPVFIHGKKQYIRFSVLPKGIKPGHVVIKDMEGQGSDNLKFDESSQDSLSAVDPNEPALPVVARPKQLVGGDSPDRNSNSPNFIQNMLQQQNLNNLDLLSNVMTPTLGPISTGGYEIENIPQESTQSTNIPQVTAPVLPPSLNINDLFQKLVASGFVTSGKEQKSLVAPTVIQKANGSDTRETNKTFGETSSNSNQALPVKPLKRNLHDNLKLITFAKPETLKIRQGNLYSMLYSGMQCSSCGMRFSPEASMQYSQHLDWHFRQNRKGKRNTRVAASRKWYYSLSDWKNYEEFEDLEEREKNYFDQQQQAENGGEEGEEEVEIPSVPADPESTDECCEVCHEKFDQFFNEEKEEWHLRNAVRVDDKTYHPICYEDFQQSFVEQSADESKLEESKEEKTEELTIPGLEIVIDDDEEESQNNSEEPTEVVSVESDESKLQPEEAKEESQDVPEEDDDDVILNEVAPIKIVVDDDDDDLKDEPSTSEDVKVKEEKLDDGFVEVAGLVSLQNGGQIKIKAEPVDPDELAMNSEKNTSTTDVEEKEPDKQPVDEQPSQFLPSHSEVITSIDGNMEIVSSTPSAVPTSGMSGNKIKINISKPLPVIPAKEKDNKSESEFPTATYIDPSEPFPPGEEPEPVSIKPALQGVKLKKLPAVKRGTELSGLCSIM
ncbi:uncharacterized protein LOC108906445 isoform X2 [Anoplophora glabripennis]|uniref:uncharacterized protein LOC108906445 isoform X2 n=1 Tax=Anoplophora glabripennis TaxID=217634 RepID=UPI000874571C|nr:uncharacterized protein LOC108906445 isoform X2 [Anoplophora glabripennis]